MVTKVGRLFGIRSQILLDVVACDFLECVVLRSRKYVWNRQRQCGCGRNDDFHSSSARRAAVKNRLRRNFFWRWLLRLQVRTVLVKAGDYGENDSGPKH